MPSAFFLEEVFLFLEKVFLANRSKLQANALMPLG